MIENNKLLAEFMGFSFIERKSKYLVDVKSYLKDESASSYKFDSDWNWLMEVVEKIEQSNKVNTGFSQLCKSKLKNNYHFYLEISLHNKSDYKKTTEASSKIEAVYNGCVEFIKSYNKK